MPVVEIPDVGAVDFPAEMSADEINSAAEELYLKKTMPAEAAALAASEKQSDLLTAQTEAARKGSYWEGVAERAGRLYDYVIEPLTRPVSGVLGRPMDRALAAVTGGETPTIEKPGPFERNYQTGIITAGKYSPEEVTSTGGKIAAGTYNAVVDLVSALSSPDMVLQLPAAANKAVLATWVSQMAAHQPERAMKAAQLFKEGKTQEAVQEVAGGVGELALAGLGARHLLKAPPGVSQPAIVAPRTSEAVRQSEATLTEAAIEGKTIEIKPVEEVIPNAIPETVKPSETSPAPAAQPEVVGVEGTTARQAPEAPIRGAEAVEVLDQGKAVAEPALGEATAVPPETPPGSRIGIVPEGTQLSMETIGNPGWWNRYFTSSRGLPEGVPEAWLKRMGEVRSETRGATYAARDLANALREEYGISVAQLAKGGLSDVPKPTMDSIQKVLTGQADLNSLPERLREPVQSIREHVDALSSKIMERLGEDNPLTAQIGENMGIYLTRSYRIFDDPKWVEKIPVEVRNQAESFLADQLGEKSGVPAEQMRDSARTKLREMLADWSDNGLDKLMRGGKLGAKDLSLFMKRKEIDPSIRAVMGEYGDPVTNYIRSITKMSRWLGDQEFLDTVKQKGMGQWLFEEGQSTAGFEHQIAAEGSQTMSPLNGLRTSEAIKDVFENFNKSQVSDSLIARVYFALNAWSKQAKTVFSALTQARNFIGNPFFNIKSGHFNFRDYGKAFKTQLADIVGSDKAAQEFYKEMTKYGLVDENPVVGELRDSIRDAGLRDPSFEDYSMKGAARVLRLAIESPQRAYRLPDEMGKTVGWIAEQSDLKSAHPEWTEAQVKQEAATRVRNEYPTYSMIPEAVQQFRKQPFVGPFVNFAYETVRNGFWALRNGSSDLFTGANAAQRRHGAKKLAGFATVLASGTALTKLGQQAFNIQKESDEDIRRFLPDYAKNNELLIYDKEGTKLRYINYSYLNPYSQMTDPFVAALNNDQPGIINGAAAAFGEFIKPFANEQMLAGAIEEVVRNRDSSDHRIYNPQADGNEIFEKVTERLLRSIEPGSLERFRRRIWPAMTGEPWPSGDERNLGLEVFSELSGLRMEQKDLTKIFGFKVREFVREDSRDARKLATSVLFSSKPPTAEEALIAYRNADDARFRLWQSLYGDYSAIMRQGGEPREIRKILSEGGLSATDINQLRRGNYVPLKIEAQDYRDAGKPIQKDALSAILGERKNRAVKRL